MSKYGWSAIECVWPLKLQYTWLSGYWPLVRLRMATSSTLLAAGILLVSPQNASFGGGEVGGGVAPEVRWTWNSHSESP